MNNKVNEELSQAKARLSIFFICLLYYFYNINFNFLRVVKESYELWGLILLGIYAFFVYFNIKALPGVYDLRRYSSIFVDISCASFIIYFMDEKGAFFYPIFLWIIIGNGIRFGTKYLLIAQCLGLIGFSTLIYMHPFWNSISYVSYGLLLSTLVLPLFFITLIRRLHDVNNHLDEMVLDKTKQLNQTISELKKSNETIKAAELKLERHNQELEEKVDLRTQDLQNNLELLAEKTLDLQTEIAQRKKVEKRIEYLAMHDELTGLANRTKLRNEVSKIFSITKRQSLLVGVLFIDLDGFKAINDTKGHEVGDIVLVETANRITETVRDFDLIARFGGDEFVVVLPFCNHINEIMEVAERVCEKISEEYELTDNLTLTSSIGVSYYPNLSTNWLELLSFADKAMYTSKQSGKNQVTLYSMT